MPGAYWTVKRDIIPYVEVHKPLFTLILWVPLPIIGTWERNHMYMLIGYDTSNNGKPTIVTAVTAQEALVHAYRIGKADMDIVIQEYTYNDCTGESVETLYDSNHTA